MKEMISLWPSYTAKKLQTVSVEQTYRRILWGQADDPGDEGRRAPLLRRMEAGADPRMMLEYVCFHGVFEGKCRPERLVRHSRLLTADCEGIRAQGLTPAQVKRAAADLLEGLMLAYTTPSGDGVRLVVKAEPAPQGALQHKQAFRQLTARLERAGLKGWSPNGADICYRSPLSFDPKAAASEPESPFRWRTNEGEKRAAAAPGTMPKATRPAAVGGRRMAAAA